MKETEGPEGTESFFFFGWGAPKVKRNGKIISGGGPEMCRPTKGPKPAILTNSLFLGGPPHDEKLKTRHLQGVPWAHPKILQFQGRKPKSEKIRCQKQVKNGQKQVKNGQKQVKNGQNMPKNGQKQHILGLFWQVSTHQKLSKYAKKWHILGYFCRPTKGPNLSRARIAKLKLCINKTRARGKTWNIWKCKTPTQKGARQSWDYTS